ncbi:MAG TPA: ATP-binding cassette domain-containing protein [Streptosporangiaceae bacterium]
MDAETGGTDPEPKAVPRGPLRPVEVATAAVLAAVAAAMAVIGSLLPHAGALELLAAVPMAIVAQRHRGRATVAAAVAASVIAFLIVGISACVVVIACSVIGVVVGTISRRRRGAWTVFALSLVIGPASALAFDLALLAFSSLRTLVFTSVQSGANGFSRILRVVVPSARGAATGLDQFIASALASWWVWIFVGVVVAMPVAMLLVWWILSAVLSRLDWVKVHDPLDPGGPGGPSGPARECVPLPVALTDVTVRYPGAQADALRGIDLRLELGQFVVIAGDNGSGKSTLLRVLAGAAANSGTVSRPGAAGLGQVGGTALVMQRPETQILGMTVADDVAWGLPAGHLIDTDRLLKEVGLEGMGDRATSDLSGGQAQRLAIASALAREPALLLSDESTSMIDSDGRTRLLALLAELPRRHQMTVVHVTHAGTEAARADRVIRMAGGRIVSDRPGPQALAPGPQTPTTPAGRPSARPAGGPDRRARPVSQPAARPPAGGTHQPAGGTQRSVLHLRDVAHTYDHGTPWAHQALRHVNLVLHPGEGLLVTGGNGSGKSTLAWILAGLIRPTGGTCLLDGRDVAAQVGSVALAFQHSRLQLQRPTVAADILAAAGRREAPPGEPDSVALVGTALDSVGLPRALAARHIDALSGGQMRRVALAGLLAASPRVLVLDEPLAGLDPGSRRRLVAALADLRQAQGLSLVVISHDIDGLDAACSRTVGLEGGVLA